MMASNVRYLVFDPNGDLIIGNEVCLQNGDIKIEFGFGIDIRIKGMPRIDFGGGGRIDMGCLSARTLSKHTGCQDYSLHEVRVHEGQYASIVYHECFENIGYHLFYEWYPFFLPSKEPHCCCKNNFNEVLLPYANKIMRSMCKHFKMEEYYGNAVLTKDLIVQC